MKGLILFFCSVAALAINTPLKAETPNAVIYSAEYSGQYDNWDISMTRTLKRTEGQYTLHSVIDHWIASITETSQFALNEGTITPKTYRYKRSIFGKKKRESLDFHNNTATYYKNGKAKPAIAIQIGDLDPSLYQLALRQQLFKAPNKQTLSVDFIRRQKRKNYTFEKQSGTQAFKVGDKHYKAISYLRTAGPKKKTHIWLIPELEYVIARIEHTDKKGDTYDVTLNNYTASGELKGILN